MGDPSQGRRPVYRVTVEPWAILAMCGGATRMHGSKLNRVFPRWIYQQLLAAPLPAQDADPENGELRC